MSNTYEERYRFIAKRYRLTKHYTIFEGFFCRECGKQLTVASTPWGTEDWHVRRHMMKKVRRKILKMVRERLR